MEIIMIVRTINWETRQIEEFETKSVRYESDGLYYTYENGQIQGELKLSYDCLLGIKVD